MKCAILFILSIAVCISVSKANSSQEESETFVTLRLLNNLIFPEFKVKESDFMAVLKRFEVESARLDPDGQGIKVRFSDELLKVYAANAASKRNTGLSEQFTWSFGPMEALWILEVITHRYPVRYSIEDESIIFRPSKVEAGIPPKRKFSRNTPADWEARKYFSTTNGAIKILKESKQFCDEYVGEGGQTPPEIYALRHLTSEMQAESIFKEMLKNASPSGKLYALCGLYFVNYAQFKVEIEPFRTSKLEVETFRGCIVNRETVAGIVESHEANTVRLNGPKESLWVWLSQNPTAKNNGYKVDIYGGGWPELLVRSRKSFQSSEKANP